MHKKKKKDRDRQGNRREAMHKWVKKDRDRQRKKQTHVKKGDRDRERERKKGHAYDKISREISIETDRKKERKAQRRSQEGRAREARATRCMYHQHGQRRYNNAAIKIKAMSSSRPPRDPLLSFPP